MARTGSVKVYYMQTLETGGFQLLCGLLGMGAVYGLPAVVALHQPHTLAVYEVYSGYRFDGSSRHTARRVQRVRKLRNICSPTLPLFSGWNWVA